jgi:hypothetical protein
MPWGSPSSSSRNTVCTEGWSVPRLLVAAWHWSSRAARRYYTEIRAEARWIFKGLRLRRYRLFQQLIGRHG